MSMDEAIERGKEKRKQYYGRKSVDPACRNHGGCPGCKIARKVKAFKRMHDNGDDELIVTPELENDDWT